jgi:hypothetical protein
MAETKKVPGNIILVQIRQYTFGAKMASNPDNEDTVFKLNSLLWAGWTSMLIIA